MKKKFFLFCLILSVEFANAQPSASDYLNVCRDSVNIVWKGTQAAAVGFSSLMNQLIDRNSKWESFFDECDQAGTLFIKSFGQLYDSAKTGRKRDFLLAKHQIRKQYSTQWDREKKQAMNIAYKDLGTNRIFGFTLSTIHDEESSDVFPQR